MPVDSTSRLLGSTGVTVSPFCLGTWELGGQYWGPVRDDEAVKVLRAAFDRGVTAYDCSDLYGGGRSEVLLGAAFARRREQVTVISKVGYLTGLDGAQAVRAEYAGPGRRDQDFTSEYLRFACELSLRRLCSDYIDVYLLHDPPAEVLDSPAAFDALRDLKRAGKIRAFGISSSVHAGLAAVRTHGAEVVMVPFNLLNTLATSLLLPLMRTRDFGVLARSPLAGGLLVDRPDGAPTEVDDLVARFGFLKDVVGESLQSAAVRYVASHPQVSTVVTGVLNEQELDADLAAVAPPYFDAETLERVHAITNRERGRQRRGEIHAAN